MLCKGFDLLEFSKIVKNMFFYGFVLADYSIMLYVTQYKLLACLVPLYLDCNSERIISWGSVGD